MRLAAAFRHSDLRLSHRAKPVDPSALRPPRWPAAKIGESDSLGAEGARVALSRKGRPSFGGIALAGESAGSTPA